MIYLQRFKGLSRLYYGATPVASSKLPSQLAAECSGQELCHKEGL